MLSHRLRVFYLHGFASIPGSRKARFFEEKLQARGVRFDVPDLAAGAFERLTISRQLELMERQLAGEPAVLIGSSLGGYLAALYAGRHPEIERVMLLAPAFDFYRLWREDLGEERLAEWKRNGWIQVFHYGEGRQLPLNYEFIEDAARFDPFPDFAQPALIFHGDNDSVVPVSVSVKFVHEHPNARLIRVKSGHELTDVLETIWLQSSSFLLPAKSVLE